MGVDPAAGGRAGERARERGGGPGTPGTPRTPRTPRRRPRARPPRRPWPDREIAAIAGGRRTLVTHAELQALGVSGSAISRAVARGRLHRRHRGVYSLVPAAALPPLAEEQAAVLAVGDGAYLSGHRAAAAWGYRRATDRDIEVTVAGRDAGRTRAGIKVHLVRSLDSRDIRKLKGIPITSPARTLLDIAPDLSDRELERAFDEAVAMGLMTRAAVRATLRANPRRPGCARLRALADEGRGATMTRSEAEERFLGLIRRAGLPAPLVNVKLGRWEADFLWRAERVVVEIDGHAYHAARTARERDHRKDAELQSSGYFVIRISARHLKHHPEEVLTRVATALARRRA